MSASRRERAAIVETDRIEAEQPNGWLAWFDLAWSVDLTYSVRTPVVNFSAYL